jgi:glycosyltransferase involved in cell wall biosynthesis
MTMVSVVVPTFNAASTIGATLDALAAQELDGDYEVIVVDDGSSDDSVAIAERSAVEATVLRQENLGAAAARNLGAAAARGEILAFTDSDCVPAPGWLRAGVDALQDADLVQGRVLPEALARPHPLDRSIWVEQETYLYESANLFLRADLFERLGGFEDLFGPVHGKRIGEDVWLGWRARRAGARTEFSDAALVHHAVFRRGLRSYLDERLRLSHFPALAAKVPELRERFFFARWFLNRRTAAFDLAIGGIVAAVILSSPLPLVAALPYLAMLLWRARGWRRYLPLAVASSMLGDLVGFGALAWGSARWRSLLI